MNGNNGKLSQRSIIALLLAVLAVILAVTPALAWFDEGDVNGQATLPCRVISVREGGRTVICMKLRPDYPRPVVAEQPPLHPAIARAEQMSIADVHLAQTPGQ